MEGSRVSLPGAAETARGSRARSVWFPRPGAVELCAELLPTVGPSDVRIRAIASALSHGTEMLVYRGQVPGDLELDLPTLRGSFAFPIKYGYASVGRIVEAGSSVRDLRVGDLVFTHHPHQTEYVVPAAPERSPAPVRLPPGITPELGVFIANLETAINVILDAAPRLGDRAVIFGQGVVGLLLTQLVRRCGAELVVAVEPLPRRQDLARTVGADVVLAGRDHVRADLLRLTDGLGADLALEASGNAAALQQAIDCVAFQGTVVVCSWYGTKPVTLELGGAFHRGRVHVISSQVGSIDPALQPRWTNARRLALARRLLPELKLAPLITHRVAFEDAADAYALVDGHPEETVQVILTYGDTGS